MPVTNTKLFTFLVCLPTYPFRNTLSNNPLSKFAGLLKPRFCRELEMEGGNGQDKEEEEEKGDLLSTWPRKQQQHLSIEKQMRSTAVSSFIVAGILRIAGSQ